MLPSFAYQHPPYVEYDDPLVGVNEMDAPLAARNSCVVRIVSAVPPVDGASSTAVNGCEVHLYWDES